MNCKPTTDSRWDYSGLLVAQSPRYGANFELSFLGFWLASQQDCHMNKADSDLDLSLLLAGPLRATVSGCDCLFL